MKPGQLVYCKPNKVYFRFAYILDATIILYNIQNIDNHHPLLYLGSKEITTAWFSPIDLVRPGSTSNEEGIRFHPSMASLPLTKVDLDEPRLMHIFIYYSTKNDTSVLLGCTQPANVTVQDYFDIIFEKQ